MSFEDENTIVSRFTVIEIMIYDTFLMINGFCLLTTVYTFGLYKKKLEKWLMKFYRLYSQNERYVKIMLYSCWFNFLRIFIQMRQIFSLDSKYLCIEIYVFNILKDKYWCIYFVIETQRGFATSSSTLQSTTAWFSF